MKISRQDIDPQLRLFGTVVRTLWPSMRAKGYRRINRCLEILFRGKNRSRRVIYRQAYAARSDGSRMRLVIYSPRVKRGEAIKKRPGVLWLHGGGYATGEPEQVLKVVRQLITEVGCTVISPAYRRSTEMPYPAALEDCELALLWLKMNADTLNVRADQLFVGGESAGGGLAAALTLRMRKTGAVKIAFQMPLYPMLDDRMQTESMRGNDAPVWNESANRDAWRAYLGDLYETDLVPSEAAAARETSLTALPPALTFVGGIDPFRDETRAYAQALRDAGVPVTFCEFPGCYHAFDLLQGHTRIGRAAKAFLLEGFRQAVKNCFAPQEMDQSENR